MVFALHPIGQRAQLSPPPRCWCPASTTSWSTMDVLPPNTTRVVPITQAATKLAPQRVPRRIKLCGASLCNTAVARDSRIRPYALVLARSSWCIPYPPSSGALPCLPLSRRLYIIALLWSPSASQQKYTPASAPHLAVPPSCTTIVSLLSLVTKSNHTHTHTEPPRRRIQFIFCFTFSLSPFSRPSSLVSASHIARRPRIASPHLPRPRPCLYWNGH